MKFLQSFLYAVVQDSQLQYVAHLEDKVEPVGPLRAHPGWEVAGDPGGGGVLRVLQQEVRADRGLAHHRDELVGEPDLNKRT